MGKTVKEKKNSYIDLVEGNISVTINSENLVKEGYFCSKHEYLYHIVKENIEHFSSETIDGSIGSILNLVSIARAKFINHSDVVDLINQSINLDVKMARLSSEKCFMQSLEEPLLIHLMKSQRVIVKNIGIDSAVSKLHKELMELKRAHPAHLILGLEV